MLNPGLKRCGAQGQIAAAGRAEPIHRAELEIIEQRFRRPFPRVGETQPLADRSALSRSVEADDGVADFRQWLQERIEFLDERS